MYKNPGDSGRLAFGPRSPDFLYGRQRCLDGEFDLADIPVAAPAAKAAVKPPFRFQWTRRSLTVSDSYEFVVGVEDLAGSNPGDSAMPKVMT